MRGSLTLSDLTVEKVSVECECGLKRRYDRRALMARVGADHDLPSLLRRLAGAEGCERAATVDTYAICQMAYAPGVIPATWHPHPENTKGAGGPEPSCGMHKADPGATLTMQ